MFRQIWICSTLSLSLLLLKGQAQAEEIEMAQPTVSPHELTYSQHADWRHFFSFLAEDYVNFGRHMLNYSPQTYGAVAGTTLVLMPFDQKARDELLTFSRRQHWLAGESQERKVTGFSLFGKPQSVFLPRSPMGVFWYLGDGSTLVMTSAAFAAYGYSFGSYRSTQVSLQILESLAIAGPTVLALKLATGRESPAESTRTGGAWHGYPGLKAYTQNQAKYYSYPSGHTAAAVATWTVLVENFPELTWLPAARGTAAGLLMLALMNVGSHWPSDYPLAILIGYTSGKSVVAEHQARAQALSSKTAWHSGQWLWKGIEAHTEELGLGLQTSWDF